jgi:WD40 repeat protein
MDGNVYTAKQASLACLVTIWLLWLVPSNARSEISYKIPTGFGWRVGLPLHLVDLEAVQRDLGLTAEASYKLQRWKLLVLEGGNEAALAVRDKAKLREIHERSQSKLEAELGLFLTQTQKERLHGIDLQMEGMNALSDAAVASTLGLSPGQNAAIRAIHNRMQREEIKSVKGGRKAGDLSMKDRDELLLAVLNSEQQETFVRLKGMEFDRRGILPTLRLRDREMEVWSVAFSPDGTRLVSSRKSELFLWDVASGKQLFTLQGHRGNITSLCFGPSGKWLISTSTDRTVKSWDVETGKLIQNHGEQSSSSQGRYIPGLGPYCFRSMALSPDGKQLAHANGTSMSISRGINATEPPFFGSGELYPGGLMSKIAVWSVAFSPDGNRYACGREDGSVYLMGVGRARKLDAAMDAVLSVAYSPDGLLLATASADRSVTLWNAIDGSEIKRLPLHEKSARCVAFNKDSTLVASAGEEGVVRVASTQNETQSIELMHPGSVTAIAFHPIVSRLATTGSDGCVRIWGPGWTEEMVLVPSAN